MFLHTTRTEWLKIKYYPVFWLLLGLTMLSYPGINYLFFTIYKTQAAKQDTAGMLVNMLVGNPFTFPEVFRTVAYASSLFIFIPAILIIMLVTNEYTYKTHRQNIIDGWSRQQFMLGKFIDVTIITLIITATYLLVTLGIGYFNLEASGTENKWSLVYYTGLFGLQVFSQLSFAFMIGLILRRSFLALSVFIFYAFILEQILAGLARWKLEGAGRFLLLEVSDMLTPVPAFLGRLDEVAYTRSLALVQPHVWLTLLYTLCFWGIALLVFRKRDL